MVWTEIRRRKPQQTWKCSQVVPRNSEKTGRSQINGWYSKTTACIGKPNAPGFEGFQFDSIFDKIKYLRTTVKFYHPIDKGNQLLLMITDGESALRCAKNIQRPETERIQGHTHRLIILNIEIATIYWCSWYWSASTITEFPRILRTDFDLLWSCKICDWNSSSQLSHRELQVVVAREGRQPQWCVSLIFKTCRGQSRARLTRFEQCQNEGWTFQACIGKPLPPRYG